MSSAPDITFRDYVSPYGVKSVLAYVQSTLGGNNLPVLQGEESNTIYLRIYNNFARAAGIASAVNVRITTFDAVDPSSHMATKSVVLQEWIRVFENAFGENSTPPGNTTNYLGTDTAVGGQGNTYVPEYGSDGSTTPQIRAGTDTNGVGFLEIGSYAQLPDAVGMVTQTFALTIEYEWTP